MTDSITKKCKKCGEVKNVSEFYYSNFFKRYTSPCKSCVSFRTKEYNQTHKAEHYERTRKWKKENPEKRNAQQRRRYSRNPLKFIKKLMDYKKSNPEVVREQKKRYKEAHPEKHREENKRYREAHPEKHREENKRYREAHPEIIKAQKQKRRAMKIGNGGSFTAKEWIDLCNQYGNICLCCKESKKLTADHVVPLISGGVNNISNIQPLCLSCNSKKGTKTIDYRKDTE